MPIKSMSKNSKKKGSIPRVLKSRKANNNPSWTSTPIIKVTSPPLLNRPLKSSTVTSNPQLT
jgi:hypothetical protein